MKKNVKALAALFLASFAFLVTACKTDVADTTPPAKVTNVNATAAKGKAVITWTNPADEDFYATRITVAPKVENGNSSLVIEGSTNEKSSASFDGLTNGTEYTFSLYAIDKSLNVSESVEIKATPEDTSDKTPPAEVSDITVTAADGEATLTWVNPTDSDFAGVKISMTPAAGTLANPVTLDRGVNTLAVTGLTIGEEYSFTIQTFDESLNYSEGATQTAIVADTSDTEAPADVTDVIVTAANGNAILTWKNPTDEDFAGVKINLSPAEGTLVNPVTLDKTVTTFTVSGLTNGTEYTFKVQSFDTSLNYSEGKTEKATPKDTSDKTAPAEVTNLSVSCVNGTNGKVNAILTWTDPSDSDLFGMEVTYVKDSNSRAAIAPMAEGSIFVAPGNGGVVITDFATGTSYTFTVKAMDTNGNKSSGISENAEMTLSQLSELKITLTPSTTEITNQDVTVTVKAESSSTVSKIYYVSGIKTSVEDVLEGTEITSASSFTATENGTYTVAAVDYDGRRELSYITVSNIDKTAPKAPTNLAASYDYGKKTITVTWNTSDSDIDHYLVSYTKAGTDVVTDEKVTEKTYTVSSVEVGATAEEYAFTVKVVDKAGNPGSEATTSVTPKAAPLVSKIELERTHFAYTEGGTTFTATVYGSNFDLISSQTDTTVKVQIVDSSNSVTTFDAVIDATNNKATATLTLPTLSSASTAGTNYTVRAKVCGTADKEHTTTFNISDVAKVSSVMLTTTQISVNSVTSETKTTATVTGTNFDVAGTIALALYDSTGTKYGDSVSVDATEFTQSTTSFEVALPVPTVDDTYTVKVLFADVQQSKTASLQVYGVPAFTSFKIPIAGTAKQDNSVTATVKGKNFTAPGVTESDFSVTCDTSSITADSVITIVSDSKLTVTLNIPGTAGSYDVTITNGSNSITGTFTVKDTEGYSVGDIILADGSKVAVADVSTTTFATSGDKVPVAVVAGFNANGAVLGLGLKRSDSYLIWAKSGTTGYNTSFTDIIAKCSGSTSSGYTFTGDLDGSDNWEYICSVDSTASANAETNYPAFNFAANYGTTQGYTDDLASGWYIPSISELYEIYKNKETLQTSLTEVGGFTIGTSYYWSSSQSSNNYSYAYKLNFSNGYVYVSYGKNYNNYVLVVRAF